jgi:hypothetical protein
MPVSALTKKHLQRYAGLQAVGAEDCNLQRLGCICIDRVKKSSPATRHGGAWGERRYSSYSFTTSALDGVSGQRHAPAALLPPGKGPPVPTGQEAGWAPEPVWTQTIE